MNNKDTDGGFIIMMVCADLDLLLTAMIGGRI